jgi:hypothetical protein
MDAELCIRLLLGRKRRETHSAAAYGSEESDLGCTAALSIREFLIPIPKIPPTVFSKARINDGSSSENATHDSHFPPGDGGHLESTGEQLMTVSEEF